MTARTRRRWINRPQGSNWGDFGEDDQRGSLNYITAEQRLRAIAEVKEGLAFGLSLPLDYPGGQVLAPHRFPPRLASTQRRGKPYFNYSFRTEAPHLCDVGCDDAVTLCTQYSTQWDSFVHIGHEFDADGDGIAERCFYNGYTAGRDILPPEQRPDGVPSPLGIDVFAAEPIQGRGVLIDLDYHFGRAGRVIGMREVAQVIDKDRLAILPGDIVCLHTGFADELLRMDRAPDPERVHTMCAAIDGHDQALLDWISDTRISALAADNYAVERILAANERRGPAFVPLHHHCLFKRGIPLGELWYLAELARHLRRTARTSFLLTAPPLRLPGAAGSPVTPVATT